MAESPFDIIRTRRSKAIESRLPMFKLLDNSYKGGFAYRAGGHLKKYSRESKETHEQRQARAVYFNYIQPIVDILVGFIFRNPVEREIPALVEPLKENCYKGKSIDTFMRDIAVNSALYTVGILVDSPNFNPEEIQTEADRRAMGLQPYPCVYYPYQIRDYAVGEDGALLWVLLDDSKVDKSNPLKEAKKKTIYRLWTAQVSQEFEIKKKSQNVDDWEVIAGEPMPHPVGYVPFHFVNWRDLNDDMVSDSPMEDIAILSEQIYNVLSLLDEMLHTGTFKTLFFPVQKRGDLQEDIQKQGLFDIAVVEYYPAEGKEPTFQGPGLSDVEPFIEALKLYSYEIFRKVGMDVDRDKSYVQSGAAIGKEFEKVEALLRYGAKAMQETEEFIFRTAGRWLGQDIDDQVEIEYSKEFQRADIDIKLQRLFNVFNLGLRPIKQMALKGILKETFPSLKDEQIEKMSQETEGNAPTWPLPSIDQARAVADAAPSLPTQNEVST